MSKSVTDQPNHRFELVVFDGTFQRLQNSIINSSINPFETSTNWLIFQVQLAFEEFSVVSLRRSKINYNLSRKFSKIIKLLIQVFEFEVAFYIRIFEMLRGNVSTHRRYHAFTSINIKNSSWSTINWWTISPKNTRATSVHPRYKSTNQQNQAKQSFHVETC